MTFKKVLIEVEEGKWRLLRAQAAEEGRPVKEVVGDAIRRYLDDPVGSARQSPSSEELVPPSRVGQALAALQAAGLSGVKTAKQLAEERERRRGDEGGSQIDERFDHET